MALLEIQDLSILFGGLKALEHVNLSIDSREIVGLIGPNGAGKTTIFNVLMGIYPPSNGTITYNGHRLLGLPAHRIAQMGIARTFQNIRLFKNLSALDNVRVAYHNQMHYGVLAGALRLPSFWREEHEATDRARAMLDVFDMGDHAASLARNLPYGMQRQLEIARALVAHPRLILLDEPAAGMNPTETQALMETIRRVRDQFQVAVLLIEHDMHLVMGICERIVVLDYGQVIATGTPEAVRADPRVVEAYLGGNQGC